MNLHQFRFVREAVRQNFNLTEAAKALFTSQPGVSKAIIELEEELGISVTEACLAPFVFASHGYDSFHLLMPLYLCRRWDGFVTAREHEALAWVKPQKLADYPMPPADAPLVAFLRDFI